MSFKLSDMKNQNSDTIITDNNSLHTDLPNSSTYTQDIKCVLNEKK